MKFSVTVSSKPSSTIRAQQLSAAFDVPASERQELSWAGEMPIEAKPWNVGLIVGPSGSGKTTILRDVFGEPVSFKWGASAVVDDFPDTLSIEDVTAACSAVGFNTIPAWLRPFGVLSNGEQFRVNLARSLVDGPDPVVMDEFTSVVDRQVAKIGAHAVAKWMRKHDRRFVAATCHYDVIDWLQPDWTFEPATLEFAWRQLQPRPALNAHIEQVPHAFWRVFAPFHYLTPELHHGAVCYVLFVEGQPAAFAGLLHRPHPTRMNLKGISRLVTLPDWQGLGLAFALADRIGAAYKAQGWDVHTYPAHPALIRSFDRSPMWEMRKAPASLVHATGNRSLQHRTGWRQGTRPNAVFCYGGPAMPLDDARALVNVRAPRGSKRVTRVGKAKPRVRRRPLR